MSSAMCPICNDDLEIENAILKKDEDYIYFCFGCNKKFELKEKSLNKTGVGK